MLARLLEDLPWTRSTGTAGGGPGLGLIAPGQDGLSPGCRGRSSAPPAGRPPCPPKGLEQAKRLLTQGIIQPMELPGGTNLTTGEPVRFCADHLRSHGDNTLLMMSWDQGTRFEWQQVHLKFDQDLWDRAFVFDLREGWAAQTGPGLQTLQTGQATRGPRREWSLYSQPHLASVATIGDGSPRPGWPPGDFWPAPSQTAPESGPLRLPPHWPDLISGLPVAFQNPDQWGRAGIGTAINSDRAKKGQRLIPSSDLRALRELRVTSAGKIRWIGVDHACAWLACSLDPLRVNFPCDKGRCGPGPFSANCAIAWRSIPACRDHATAAAVLGPVLLLASDRVALGTKRKASGPPGGE